MRGIGDHDAVERVITMAWRTHFVVEPSAQVVDLWFRHEQVAMHFNELLIQFRLQLLGGAGALGALAGSIIGARVADVAHRHWLRFLVAAGLSVLVSAGAILDLFYYSLLLEGAVQAIIDIERTHPGIQLSTVIRERVGFGVKAAWFAYGIVWVPLVGFTLWSWVEHKISRAKTARRGRKLAT